jgi:phosphoribosyl 1,2-cyclic phosphodiesterase
MSKDFSVRFWGVRGSVACCAADIVRYGGNTSCLEIACGDRTLIFDAGTGLRYLGQQLVKRGKLDCDLFLTHTHFDHVCGLPFFVPFFIPGNVVRMYAGNLAPTTTLYDTLCNMMMAPLFPVPPSIFAAQVDFKDFAPGHIFDLGDGITIRTAPLNHPNGATGYRVDFDGRSICYLTDTEHFPDRLDENILGLIKGADIVIYDAMFTEAEHATRKGWGHSTWRAGAVLCDAANAGTYVVFHHDPDHNDEFMDRIAVEVAEARPGSVVAREGMVLSA